MARRTSADLPLHTGSAPRWLFDRMVELSEAISETVIEEYGQDELLRRLSDPYWFQALGCVLGFDWHSSGVTTTTMGALKEALSLQEYGITVVGGKGATSRQTPDEIDTSAVDHPNLLLLSVSTSQPTTKESASKSLIGGVVWTATAHSVALWSLHQSSD